MGRSFMRMANVSARKTATAASAAIEMREILERSGILEIPQQNDDANVHHYQHGERITEWPVDDVPEMKQVVNAIEKEHLGRNPGLAAAGGNDSLDLAMAGRQQPTKRRDLPARRQELAAHSADQEGAGEVQAKYSP